MKIISKFKDYYDHQAHVYGGGDPLIVYERKRLGELLINGLVTEVILNHDNDTLANSLKVKEYLNVNTIMGWLIVCGKPFPLVDVGRNYVKPEWEIFDTVKHKQYIDEDQNTKWNRIVRNRKGYIEVGQENSGLIELSKQVGHPVFIISAIRWNHYYIDGNCPILDGIGLAKYYPAEQLYQDLSYFIGNMMKDSPDTQPPVVMSDDVKITNHGFDKQSFKHRK